MLLYLGGHTQTDVSFSVNHCSRYKFNSKKSHEEVIKHVSRYLKGTRIKGVTFRPIKDLKIDIFVDTDFSGIWNHEDDQDPTNVKSRSRFLFMVRGF